MTSSWQRSLTLTCCKAHLFYAPRIQWIFSLISLIKYLLSFSYLLKCLAKWREGVISSWLNLWFSFYLENSIRLCSISDCVNAMKIWSISPRVFASSPNRWSVCFCRACVDKITEYIFMVTGQDVESLSPVVKPAISLDFLIPCFVFLCWS